MSDMNASAAATIQRLSQENATLRAALAEAKTWIEYVTILKPEDDHMHELCHDAAEKAREALASLAIRS